MKEIFWVLLYFTCSAVYLGSTASMLSQKKFGWFGLHGAFTVYFMVRFIQLMFAV